MKSIERTPTLEELNSQSEAERTDERMNEWTEKLYAPYYLFNAGIEIDNLF